MHPNEDEIQAYVTLRPPADSGGPVSAANVRMRMASPEQQRAACMALEACGFSVVRTSPLSISVKGSRQLYEQVFGREIVGESVPESMEQTPAWRWDGPPRIPESMADMVADVVLPKPVSPHQY